MNNTLDLERPMLRMGSIAFFVGLVIAVVSTFVFHPSGTGEELMNNPFIFGVYAEDPFWIASHVGQFAGILLIFAGGFVALHRLLVKSESATASALSWLGLVTAIITASAFTILQAVDGIALKIAVNTWYAIPAGEVSIAAGVVTAYVGFSSVRDPVADLSTLIFYPWLVTLGIFMWRKTREKKVITT